MSESLEFPKPRLVRANGIQLAVYEQGAGVPVVFSHGFPELAYSWRHQLPALAAAGFRAIAPDQRGYGASDRPEAVEAYDIAQLTGDLVSMLDSLGIDKAVFCGHDWGGMVIWTLGQLHPSRVLGLIGVNTPFMARSAVPPLQMLEQMMGPEHYIVHFQKRGDADARLMKDVTRVFDVLMRKGIKLSDIDMTQGIRNMATMVEDGRKLGRPMLTDSERDVFVRGFRRTGFTGGINWYRNLDRNWRLTADAPQVLDVPALMVMSEDDFALPPAMAEGMEARVPKVEKVLIRDCGHWTQQEKPAELNRILVDWLRRHFA